MPTGPLDTWKTLSKGHGWLAHIPRAWLSESGDWEELPDSFYARQYKPVGLTTSLLAL